MARRRLPAQAHHTAQHTPTGLPDVGLEQRLHAFIPLELAFWDATGRPVTLGDYFGTKPVILTLAYYDCPNLCTLVLNGLLQDPAGLPLTLGKDFYVLTVSINPDDTTGPGCREAGAIYAGLWPCRRRQWLAFPYRPARGH